MVIANPSESKELTDHKHETTGKMADAEKQQAPIARTRPESAYAGLGWLDRLLALWILLAIIIGILLGNFVDGVESALQRGKFVDVSVPIGELSNFSRRNSI